MTENSHGKRRWVINRQLIQPKFSLSTRNTQKEKHRGKCEGGTSAEPLFILTATTRLVGMYKLGRDVTQLEWKQIES